MTVKTTLSFTDRHHAFLLAKVEQGVYASASSAVATAIEQMMEDDSARGAALEAMAQEIRARLQTPTSHYLDPAEAFDAARALLQDG
ncbi:type II toxin-antitoxin system ParD family antitoxin [Amaricoccus sp.]|uniref:type II toxin-antitoxin system ParD family antitoxin n=1 Tax=Amaricoccus sp. TaxID=1872485 RepID=UPI001B652F64|nr:type II toxin-antitoxin system ParD family antitoxin [Amaricoccus sp.]MBP7002045.1 type II toxin-antitoxin system ParD family antitoxin [Amaricoccus sp.]